MPAGNVVMSGARLRYLGSSSTLRPAPSAMAATRPGIAAAYVWNHAAVGPSPIKYAPSSDENVTRNGSDVPSVSQNACRTSRSSAGVLGGNGPTSAGAGDSTAVWLAAPMLRSPSAIAFGCWGGGDVVI